MRTKLGIFLIVMLFTLSACSAVTLDISEADDQDNEEQSNKTKVTIEVKGLSSKMLAGKASISSISVLNGEDTVSIADYLEIVVSEPSGPYYAVAMYSDGLSVVNGLFPTHPGVYTITISVIEGNDDYYGEYVYEFEIVESTDQLNNDDNEGSIFLYVAAAILIALGAFVIYIAVFKREWI